MTILSLVAVVNELEDVSNDDNNDGKKEEAKKEIFVKELVESTNSKYILISIFPW